MVTIRRLILGILLLTLATPALAEVRLNWGRPKNPYLREAKLEMDRGQYFSAIGHLLAERSRGKLGREQMTADLMLTGAYLNYGMHEEAGQILDKLQNSRLGVKTKGQLWLELANMRYRRGYLSEAAMALGGIDEDRVPYYLLTEKYNIQALILMQQGRDQDAIRVLRALRGDGDWTLLGRYNLATALMRNNLMDQGTNVLEKVLRLIPGDPEMRALRDRSLYTLGFVALQKQELDKARERFRGIRLDSPIATRAMLGLGLAYASSDRHEEAIKVWDELIRKHPSDPSVLESLLALPLSYMQLGAQQQSVKLFQHAMDVYEKEIERINLISTAIDDGSLIKELLQELLSKGDGFLDPENMPGLPEFRYLQGVYESHPFQVAMNNYRDLLLMNQRMRQWTENLQQLPSMSETFRRVYADKVAEKHSELVMAAEELRQHIARMALMELERRRNKILMFSRHAMFAIAQNYDDKSFALDKKRGR